jgi:hypothetical protein
MPKRRPRWSVGGDRLDDTKTRSDEHRDADAAVDRGPPFAVRAARMNVISLPGSRSAGTGTESASSETYPTE